MKLFPDCYQCHLCWGGEGGCIAGIGDDDFGQASKEDLIERYNNYVRYDKPKRIDIRKALKEWYNIEIDDKYGDDTNTEDPMVSFAKEFLKDIKKDPSSILSIKVSQDFYENFIIHLLKSDHFKLYSELRSILDAHALVLSIDDTIDNYFINRNLEGDDK